MTFMRKILDALNMDNWDGNSVLSRSLHVLKKLLFSIQTLLLFLPFMLICSTLVDSEGNRISSNEYVAVCLASYVCIFIPINIVIRCRQANRHKMRLIEFLKMSNMHQKKEESHSSEPLKIDKPVSEEKRTVSDAILWECNSVVKSQTSEKIEHECINLDNIKDSSNEKLFTASSPLETGQETTISSEKNVKDHLNQNNMKIKQPKEKKVPISDAFFWQCNSIATLRDSDDIGYEYTNLDNPNDPLETGYRNALLDISDYSTLPLIDYSKDKYAPGGYIPRKLISWEHDFEECKNIFLDSDLPIVTSLKSITRNINTMILQNPDGTIGRTVQEIFYYEIPLEYQNDYLQLIKTLNLALHDQEQFLINLSEIVFTRTANYMKYALPLSRINYNSEKHIFSYFFSNEKTFEENGGTLYKSTETGSIIYAEDGTLKKATLRKEIEKIAYTCRFKNYKSGFDLYDIRGNGQIIYKRNSK